MRDWKTTAGGAISGAVLVLAELTDFLGIQVESLPTDGTFSFEMLVTGLGLMSLGVFARDKEPKD